MFYHLLYRLHEHFGAFRVFQYITFRAAMATLSALLVALLLGPGMIRRLQQFQADSVATLHCCVSCGRTELSDPDLEFRVTASGEEFCREHLPAA